MLENLKSQIESAAISFKNHNFKNALVQYNQCIRLATSSRQSKQILLNLYSSEAAILSILQRNQEALQILNQALQQSPYHLACLTRRSQVYKKLNKYKKGLKDLNMVSLFSPDNIHISAMKVQMENLILKNPQAQNEQSQDQLNQEQLLNFCNLKMIDKISCHTIPQANIKQSQGKMRVTITGDRTFQYRKQDNNNNVKRLSKQQICQKLTQTLNEIKRQKLADQPIQENGLAISINATFNGKKSILKNRASELFVNLEKFQQNQEKALTQSKLAQKVTNIDGKPIYGEKHLDQTNGPKQVEFRKSSFGSSTLGSNAGSTLKKNQLRKSCLKNSFASQFPKFNLGFSQLANTSQITESNYSNLSKFSRLSRQSIDGTFIRKSVDEKKQDRILQNQQNECDSDSEEGSSHNIYGDNQQLMSRELRQNFGIDLESGNEKKKQKKERKLHKSILKTPSDLFTKSYMGDDRKAKKSVMFKG